MAKWCVYHKDKNSNQGHFCCAPLQKEAFVVVQSLSCVQLFTASWTAVVFMMNYILIIIPQQYSDVTDTWNKVDPVNLRYLLQSRYKKSAAIKI